MQTTQGLAAPRAGSAALSVPSTKIQSAHAHAGRAQKTEDDSRETPPTAVPSTLRSGYFEAPGIATAVAVGASEAATGASSLGASSASPRSAEIARNRRAASGSPLSR